MHQSLKLFIFYFCLTLFHVSDGLSFHHQEFRTVYTATGICQTDKATCLLGGMLVPANKQVAVSV
jgi:hypothetical protein